MGLIYRKRLLAAKIETTPGDAIALAAADAAVNVYDLKIVPELALEERLGQGVIDRLSSVIGEVAATVTFWVDMFGAAADPFWFATFLPACSMPITTHAAIAKHEAVGTNVKTLTLGVYVDGNLNTLRGCHGNVVFRFTAGKRMRAEFTFKGVWVAPSAVALLTPTHPAQTGIIFQSSALAFDAYQPQIQELTIDLGNDVVPLYDSRALDGVAYFHGGGIRPKGTLDPLASALGTKNLYTELTAGTTSALAIACGTAPNKITVAAPKVQWTKVTPDERRPNATERVEFDLLESSGEDALTITNVVA